MTVLTLDHPIIEWMVRHASWLITHFLVKSDGKTPDERLRQRPYNGEIVCLSVTVHYKLPRQEVGKADDRCSIGIWLGETLKSDEHILGTRRGVFPARSIWRRPEKQRCSKSSSRVRGNAVQASAPRVESSPVYRCVVHSAQIDSSWSYSSV